MIYTRNSEFGEVEIGRLILAYLPGHNGPVSFDGWVSRVDFERLRRTVAAFTLVRKLQALVEAEGIDQLREILDSGGVNLDQVTQPKRRRPPSFELTIYRWRPNKGVPTRFLRVSLEAHTIARANLVDTHLVQAGQ